MNTIQRAKNILMTPKTEWNLISEENNGHMKLLTDKFDSLKNFDKAFELVVYSYTPMCIAGILLIYTPLSFLATLGGLYGLYLLYVGLVPMLQTSGEKKTAFFLVSLLAATQVDAQSWLNKVGKKVENAAKRTVERKAEQKTEEAVGKAVDKATDKGTYQGSEKGKDVETIEWTETEPVAPNTTPEGKASNRRVEFVKQ